jgi:hypothetical protein
MDWARVLAFATLMGILLLLSVALGLIAWYGFWVVLVRDAVPPADPVYPKVIGIGLGGIFFLRELFFRVLA